MRSKATETNDAIDRVQTGVRMERRLVKVCKALAELYDLSLGSSSKISCATPSPAARRSQTSPWRRPPS